MASTLVQASQRLHKGDLQFDENWLPSLREKENAKEASNAKKMQEVTAGGEFLNPLNFLATFDKVRVLTVWITIFLALESPR